MGSSASQRAVWPYMAIPPEEAGQADFSLPAIAIGVQAPSPRKDDASPFGQPGGLMEQSNASLQRGRQS